MKKTFVKITLFIAFIGILSFILFIISQTAQVTTLATQINPIFGQIVLWTLILTYIAFALVPLIIYLRLPPPLNPPKSEDSPEFEKHLKALRRQLSVNPHLENPDLSSRQRIEEALELLNEKATHLIKETASTVFLTTAVSQNGRLDAFLVLAAETKLIWKLAHIYYQRPTIRDMTTLYANVAGTAFIASELQDLDISAQMEPILSTAFGSFAGSTVPGIHHATTIFINSVTTGTANSFLTLRIGMITKLYCSALVLEEKRTLRRSATAESARLLGSIVTQGASRLSAAVWTASKSKVGGAVSGVKDYIKETGSSIFSKIGASGSSQTAQKPAKE